MKAIILGDGNHTFAIFQDPSTLEYKLIINGTNYSLGSDTLGQIKDVGITDLTGKAGEALVVKATEDGWETKSVQINKITDIQDVLSPDITVADKLLQVNLDGTGWVVASPKITALADVLTKTYTSADKGKALILNDAGTVFERDNELVKSIPATFGLTEEQIDDLFIYANTL